MENRTFPAVTADAEALIRAPVATVWSVLTAIEDWPRWNDDVARVAITGPVEPGTAFRWKAGGMPIASVLTVVEPRKHIAWKGRALGIRAVHEWTLDVRDDGVLVRTTESFDGLLPRLLKGWTTNMLTATLNSSVAMLKKECERQAGEMAEQS